MKRLLIFSFTIAAAVYLLQDLAVATEDASPSRGIPEQAKAARREVAAQAVAKEQAANEAAAEAGQAAEEAQLQAFAAQAAAKKQAAKEAMPKQVLSDLRFQKPIVAKDETTISVYNARVAEEENVIATRLQGTWQANAALTNHLGGNAVNGHITFENDPEATGRMPRWLVELITAKNKTVYMAGVVELMDRKHDFVLTEKNGAPVIFLFDKDTPDPATAPLAEVLFASPLEVIVAAAKRKDRDLLILRGPTYFTHHYPIGVFSRTSRKDGNESSDARNGLIREELLPKARRLLDQRTRDYQAGNANILEVVDAARQLLELEMRAAKTSEQKIAAIESQKRLLKDTLAIAEQLNRAGKASKADVLAIDLEVAQLDLKLLELKGSGGRRARPPSPQWQCTHSRSLKEKRGDTSNENSAPPPAVLCYLFIPRFALGC